MANRILAERAIHVKNRSGVAKWRQQIAFEII
jgi:hypothetical protein